MLSDQDREQVARVIDANANRLREGLRVVEEICRLVLNNIELTQTLKAKRHLAGDLIRQLPLAEFLLEARDSRGDIGAQPGFDTHPRKTIEDILRANLGRAQESCRVLEEFSKLFDQHISESFKEIRFDLYTVEKKLTGTLYSGPDEPST